MADAAVPDLLKADNAPAESNRRQRPKRVARGEAPVSWAAPP
jgi:hypothetical protein